LGRALTAEEEAKKAEAATLADYRGSTDDAIEQLIGSKPVLGPQEKTYLEKTLKRWQAFADRVGDDQQVRAIRAEGQFHVAYLRHKLGLGEEVAAGYREALAIEQKLVDDFPAVPEYRQELAASHYNLGLLLADQNQPEQAAQQHRKVLAIQQKLADEFPAVPVYRQELASSHNNLGVLLAGQNQKEQAAEQYRKALAIRHKLADDFPAVHAYRHDLAHSHNSLGVLLADQNQVDKAAEQYRRALAIQQKLANDFPSMTAYHVGLGGSCYNFGNLLRSGGRPADGVPWYDKAIRTLTRVDQQDPRFVPTRLLLRNSHGSRAQAYDLLEKHSEAVKDWTRVIELSPPPEQPSFRLRRADSRVRAGQVAETVAEIAALSKSPTVTVDQWYDFACIYALASGKATDKKQEYADQAM